LSQSSARSDDVVAERTTLSFAADATTAAGSFVPSGRRRGLPRRPYHFVRCGIRLEFRGCLDLGPAEGQQHLPIGPSGREPQQPPIDRDLAAADAEKPAEIDDSRPWIAIGAHNNVNHQAQIRAIGPHHFFAENAGRLGRRQRLEVLGRRRASLRGCGRGRGTSTSGSWHISLRQQDRWRLARACRSETNARSGQQQRRRRHRR